MKRFFDDRNRKKVSKKATSSPFHPSHSLYLQLGPLFWAHRRFDMVIGDILSNNTLIPVRDFPDFSYQNSVLRQHRADVRKCRPTIFFSHGLYLCDHTPLSIFQTVKWVPGFLRLILSFCSSYFLLLLMVLSNLTACSTSFLSQRSRDQLSLRFSPTLFQIMIMRIVSTSVLHRPLDLKSQNTKEEVPKDGLIILGNTFTRTRNLTSS